MNVIPLTMQTVDWRSFLLEAKSSIGHSITKELDSRKVNVDNLQSFMACLGALSGKGYDDSIKSLRLAEHIHFSFLIIVDTETGIRILQRFTGPKISAETLQPAELIVCSGTLNDWYSFIVDCCTKENDSEIRKVGTAIQMYIEAAGFKKIWPTKQKQKDHTYIME